MVGHYTNPGDLLDGGFTGTPNLAFYNPNGTWDVENHGVPPDVEAATLADVEPGTGDGETQGLHGGHGCESVLL